MNEGRTHLLGGIIDNGFFTEGVCADDCWCMKEEEE
jgi:hypothetical protein